MNKSQYNVGYKQQQLLINILLYCIQIIMRQIIEIQVIVHLVVMTKLLNQIFHQKLDNILLLDNLEIFILIQTLIMYLHNKDILKGYNYLTEQFQNHIFKIFIVQIQTHHLNLNFNLIKLLTFNEKLIIKHIIKTIRIYFSIIKYNSILI